MQCETHKVLDSIESWWTRQAEMLPIGSSGDSQASSDSGDLVLIHSLPSVGNLLSQGLVVFSSESIGYWTYSHGSGESQDWWKWTMSTYGSWFLWSWVLWGRILWIWIFWILSLMNFSLIDLHSLYLKEPWLTPANPYELLVISVLPLLNLIVVAR